MFPFSLNKRLAQREPNLIVQNDESFGYELVTFDKEKINVFAAQVRCCEPHWHNAAEFIYVLQGGFAVTVNRNLTQLNAGGMLYINGDEIHSLDAIEKDSVLLTVQFSPSLFDELHHGLLLDYCVNGSNDYRRNDIRVKRSLAALINDCLISSDFASFHKMSLIYMLLSDLEKAGTIILDIAQVSTYKKDEQLIKECIKYINNHYSEELSLSQLAERAGVSYHYFSKLFKKISGYNFKEYLTFVRVNKAKFLLKNTQVPITDISHSCGFSEHKHLIAVFRKYYSMTPTEFRKNYVSEMSESYNDIITEFKYIELSSCVLDNVLTACGSPTVKKEI